VTVYVVSAVIPFAALIVVGWAKRVMTPLEAVTSRATEGRDSRVTALGMTP
jgi:hypothetical protein